MLLGEGRPPDAIERVVGALETTVLDAAVFDSAEHALLHYAEVLTRDPSSIRPAHIEALRAAGLDDLAIHDACAIVAYFAFVNRIADGLGVGLE